MLRVTANRPLHIYEDPNGYVLEATEEDVKQKTEFLVPDTDWWNHKCKPEKLLNLLAVETTDEEKKAKKEAEKEAKAAKAKADKEDKGKDEEG